MANHPAAAIAILDRCELRLTDDSTLPLILSRAWSTLGDRRKALRAARMSQQHRIRALIQVGRDLEFVSPGETELTLLDEILGEINALNDPVRKDSYLPDLAIALRNQQLTGAALQVTRMIQSPYSRAESVVNPDFLAGIDPASVHEALDALNQIDDSDDREAMEDYVAQALAALGLKEEALRLVAASPDEFRRCWRTLRVAEGFMERRDFAAALDHTVKATEEFCGRLSGGLSDSMYGDAAVLFARLGEFDRVANVAAVSDKGHHYVADKTVHVCTMLVAAGRGEQALELARSIPEVASGARAIIAIAESRAQSGEADAGISLLHDTANALLAVLEREVARRRTAANTIYISDRASLEYRSAAALNQVAGAYFRLGQIDQAIKTAARPIPEGADRNLFSLQSQDCRELAIDAVRANDPQVATILLGYAFECAKAIHPHLPYERAEQLAGLVVPYVAVDRAETAAHVWTTIRESSFDRVSLLNACIHIATDCGLLHAQMPDALSVAICDALDKM